jgi:hypothetical protein
MVLFSLRQKTDFQKTSNSIMGIELRSKDTHYYICDHSEESHLAELPWGEKQFDAFIVILRESAVSSDLIHIVIAELVMRNTDWIETVGPKSEWLHDEIEKASVRLGRQKQVGDGSPMTAWHNDIKKLSDMVEYVGNGGHGGNDYKAVIVIGNPIDFTMFVEELKENISREDL